MRRRVTMLIALVLPFAAYSIAGAQPKPKAQKASGATAASSSDAGTSASLSANASSGDGGAPAAAASVDGGASLATASATAPTPPPAVSVDMNAKSPDQPMNGGTYAVRLRDLEQRVDELKDQIRRSHTRLALLSDTILGGGVAGSRAEVGFDNEMSSAFLLKSALFVIDGQVQYNRQDDSGALADQKSIPIYSGSVPPGDHTIQVALGFQGNGFGVFSYLRGYKFDVKSSHAFTALEGKAVSVTATAFEKGGVTTPLEQRPTIEWHEKIQALASAPATTVGSPLGAPPAAQVPASAPTVAPSATVRGSLSVGASPGSQK